MYPVRQLLIDVHYVLAGGGKSGKRDFTQGWCVETLAPSTSQSGVFSSRSAVGFQNHCVHKSCCSKTLASPLPTRVRRRVRATMDRDRTELVIYRARGIIYTDCSASNQSLFRIPTFLQMIRIFSQLWCILYESSTVQDISSPEVQRLSSPTLYPLSSR